MGKLGFGAIGSKLSYIYGPTRTVSKRQSFMSATFSAIIIVGAFVFPANESMHDGRIRQPAGPWTLEHGPSGSTTEARCHPYGRCQQMVNGIRAPRPNIGYESALTAPFSLEITSVLDGQRFAGAAITRRANLHPAQQTLLSSAVVRLIGSIRAGVTPPGPDMSR